MICSLALLAVFSAGVEAQAVVASRRLVRATGDATLSVKPDQAKINVGVVTQAATAQEASTQNATQVDAVLNRLKQVLGASGDMKTIGYSLTANYKYPQGGGQPTLTGYTASNTVEVTTNDLSLIGKLIDTATQAGATNVSGLRFTLKDAESLQTVALAMAARQARSHADGIAAGLGLRLGAVITAQEGAVTSVVPIDTRTTAAGGTQTPIETGTVDIRATVTVDVEIM
jgi:uncharacterized protein YggE